MPQRELFSTETTPVSAQPLAYRIAPQAFSAFAGQDHIIGPGKPLQRLIESDQLMSLILWGPPGTGKTSLSRLISKKTKADYQSLNAVTAKIADIKAAIDQARQAQQMGLKTILFIDEIHRFNKVQQDALLPDVESGRITLIGATTENPFFSVIPALISRAQVFELKPLNAEQIRQIIQRAITAYDARFSITEDAITYLISQCHGDARKAINLIELTARQSKNGTLTQKDIEALTQSKGIAHSLDAHYDLISAFIKSMRGSDATAAVYWLARMLKGGEDPDFIARRLIIFASEDIGLADPQALPLATACLDAVKFVGLPEAQINLSHVTTYMAKAPKSRQTYTAIKQANHLIESGKVFAVPNHLRATPALHDPDAKADKGYLPEEIDLFKATAPSEPL